MEQLWKIYRRMIWFYRGAMAIQVVFVIWHLYRGSWFLPFFHLGFLFYFDIQRKKWKRKFLADLDRLEKDIERLKMAGEKHLEELKSKLKELKAKN